MGLGKLAKPTHNRVMGIDASTNSLAFCIMEGTTPVKWGEVQFKGATPFERLRSARAILDDFPGLDVDYIVIEAAVMVRSASVGIKMAYVFGAIIGELTKNGAQVVEVYPIQWQSYIGNKNWTKAQKDAFKKEFPDKKASWYSNEIRKRRKDFTRNWVKSNWGYDIDSDNVTDAFGLAYYAAKELTS